MAAFTFYSTDGQGNQTGNVCIATASTDQDHYEPTQWITSLVPLADDLIAIIGHSYGGNRARLFTAELQLEYNIPVTLLPKSGAFAALKV